MESTAWIKRHRAQIDLAARITAAGVLAYALGHWLGLRQSQWAVLTAVIVTQGSVGASVSAMVDRFAGTVGGAVWGVIVSLGLRYSGAVSPGVALAFGVAPLALATALKPAYRIAPITFIILLLTPSLQASGPVQTALQRTLEIGLGSLAALAVSLAVLPARAQKALAAAVSDALRAMAELTAWLPDGLTQPSDLAAVHAAHDRIRGFIAKAEAAAVDVQRERASYLTSAPDPLPICRTLRRLRHDLAILGRTLATPLPGSAAAGLAAPVSDTADTVTRFFTASAEAMDRGQPPPSLAAVDASFARHAAAVSAMRRQGVTRDLPDDDLSRIFGMGFALDQLHRDLQDLVDRAGELARPSASRAGGVAAMPAPP